MGKETETGGVLQEDGSIFFRIYAPGSRHVAVEMDKETIELERMADGFFEGKKPGTESCVGLQTVNIYFDGEVMVCPCMPVLWHQDRPVNFLDIPDPETPWISLEKIPHGSLSRELFFSKKMERWQRCMVYTPPGYQKSRERYPVLYLQHGGTENETCWSDNGRLPYILDSLLEKGRCRPFLVVMCDGTTVYDENAKYKGIVDRAFEDMLLGDCIPYIEETYRVKKGKWNRALAGLSMGAFQTGCIGLGHPELFGYLGIFSGSFSKNLWNGENKYAERLKDAGWLEREYRLLFRSIGEKDAVAGPGFERDDRTLKEKGLYGLPCHVRRIYSGQVHEWGAWRRALYDFAQLLF